MKDDAKSVGNSGLSSPIWKFAGKFGVKSQTSRAWLTMRGPDRTPARDFAFAVQSLRMLTYL